MNKTDILYCSPHKLAGLPQSAPVLLAFSGGMDSAVLLDLLSKEATRSGFELHAAHFNHHIRGNEAARDADFCKNEAKKKGAIFHLGEADIPSLAKQNGTSLEAEGRAQRYAFFEKVMRENNIPLLVTAHHADDNAESILLHIIRGSGIGGLSGILPVRQFARDMLIVRPLLHTQKQDIINYCEAHSIEFVTDSTNFDTQYVRNAIRANVMPRLEELQPNICDVFSRLAKNAHDDNELLLDMARKFVADEWCGKSIPTTKLNSAHKAIRARALSLKFNEISGSTLEYVHIASLIELSEKEEPHSSISLPCGITASIEDGALSFNESKEPLEIPHIFQPFGVGTFKTDCQAVITVTQNPQGDEGKDGIFIDIKATHISDDAHFRTKLDGDTVTLNGMNKKIKKLFNEKKIPLDTRKRIPLLVSDNKILWIPTIGVCDTVNRDKIKSGDNFFRIAIKLENN